jgi:undecaprenyl-diphosphatase
MIFWIVVAVLGIVEGLTEFIPVSSTGHLIVADALLNFKNMIGEDKAALFEIVIQLGAILAIGLIYREKLIGATTRSLTKDGPDRRLLIGLILGFIPIAVAGLVFGKKIKHFLFSPLTVAVALIVGGIVILVIERLPLRARSRGTEQITFGQALAVGLTQMLALIPGTSRSAATIMGGLCAGMDRPTATEFSFLLSFPVMLAASGYDLFKSRHLLDGSMVMTLVVGFVVSFLVAAAVVKWLIRYVQRHKFTPFAVYRIVFGGALLALVLTHHIPAS